MTRKEMRIKEVEDKLDNKKKRYQVICSEPIIDGIIEAFSEKEALDLAKKEYGPTGFMRHWISSVERIDDENDNKEEFNDDRRSNA